MPKPSWGETTATPLQMRQNVAPQTAMSHLSHILPRKLKFRTVTISICTIGVQQRLPCPILRRLQRFPWKSNSVKAKIIGKLRFRFLSRHRTCNWSKPHYITIVGGGGIPPYLDAHTRKCKIVSPKKKHLFSLLQFYGICRHL